MKNQTQIETKSSRGAGERQQQARVAPVIQMEILLSSATADRLDQFAGGKCHDRDKYAQIALRDYTKFIPVQPELALSQDQTIYCDKLLGFTRGQTDSVYHEFARICLSYDLNVNATADRAIAVYLDAQCGNSTLDFSDGLDTENIECILQRPTAAGRAALARLTKQSFQKDVAAAVDDLQGIRDMIALHPGFRKERHAIDMVISGFGRLNDRSTASVQRS
jgi:hypothetical protein